METRCAAGLLGCAREPSSAIGAIQEMRQWARKRQLLVAGTLYLHARTHTVRIRARVVDATLSCGNTFCVEHTLAPWSAVWGLHTVLIMNENYSQVLLPHDRVQQIASIAPFQLAGLGRPERPNPIALVQWPPSALSALYAAHPRVHHGRLVLSDVWLTTPCPASRVILTYL